MNHSCARAANQRPVARRDSLSKIPLLWLTNCDLCGWRLAGRIDRALNFSASWGRVWVLLTAESLRLVKRHQSHDTPWVAACHEDWDGRREFRSKWSQYIARICCQRRWRDVAEINLITLIAQHQETRQEQSAQAGSRRGLRCRRIITHCCTSAGDVG